MIDPSEIAAARLALGRLLAKCRRAAGLNQRDLAPHTYYGRSTIANVETGRQNVPRAFWERCERALNADGCLLAAADHLEALVQRQRQETAQLADDTALSAPARVLQALEIVMSDQADTLTIATDCLNELISHYSEKLSVSPPTDMYDDLLNVRSYAGTLLERLRSPTRHTRSGLIVAAGWLSNLLAVATSYMGDHGSALIWCVDAERRSYESGYPDIAGWAALTRAMIAYYQGRAGRSIELASNGQEVAPIGTIAHAKLAAQEMRARAMLGDAEGMAQAKRRATKAIAVLPSDVATTGVFSIALSEDPQYTATSLLLVKRFREAASVTEDVIQAAYPTGTRNRNRQSSSYARTLLILGLAEAGLGHVDEAVAAGRAALNSTGVVWPTLVLADKLDQTLMRDHEDAAEVVEYHARYLDVADRASSEFQHARLGLSLQGKK